MGKIRDHKKAYQRRIARAAERGLSRSQARGHARVGEPAIRPDPAKDRDRFEAALKLYRESGNQAVAAKALNLAPERLRRFLRENVQIEGRGRTLKITDNRVREMSVISKGTVSTVQLRDFEQASLNGQHLSAVKAFLSSNEIEFLEPFAGRSVIDAKSKTHPLGTDPNALYRIAAAGSEVFHNVYRLII